MSFCTKCGNRLAADLKFCTQCGAPIPEQTTPEGAEADKESQVSDPAPQTQAVVAPPPPTAAEWQPLPVVPAQQNSPPTNRGCLRTVVVALCVLTVVAALGIGGLVYLGYKMKQKATAILHKAEDGITAPNSQPAVGPDGKPESPGASSQDGPSGVLGDLARMLEGGKGNGSGDIDGGDPVPSVSERDPVEPCTAAPFPPQSSARIPLQEGTVITTAWGVKYEDVESRVSLEPVTPLSISMLNSTGAYKLDSGGEARPSSYTNTVCNADIASAGTYVTVVGMHVPHLIHGVTRLRLSDKSFNEVKSSGKINFEYLDYIHAGNDAEKPVHDAGLLTRVEPQDIPYPMIVNDERVTLPTIHLAGFTDPTGKDPRPKKWRPNHAAADLYVLDDPLDPLVLLWKEKDPALHDGKFRIEVVKIDFKPDRPVNIVEKQLTEQKRAVTYGIYFDFNKDTIKPESEPVLKQIVQAMTDNPTWKLTVEGHTDNIGGDSYNLDLSKRRAAAVKQTLIARYHISPDRLSADGFGASRPVEPNDTLEGRARNRRVELTRE
jgi:outer membrane protein OmpA-like peptidoglycan-associated protein